MYVPGFASAVVINHFSRRSPYTLQGQDRSIKLENKFFHTIQTLTFYDLRRCCPCRGGIAEAGAIGGDSAPAPCEQEPVAGIVRETF